MKIMQTLLNVSIVYYSLVIAEIWFGSESEIYTRIGCCPAENKVENIEFSEFITTGYYKPLKKQKTYYFGSYLDDIRINGKGEFTTTGLKPRVGLIAADPNILPFGTVVEIPEYGRGIVQDTGSQIKGNRIDLFMGAGEPALKKAKQWGKKKMPVKIIWLAKK